MEVRYGRLRAIVPVLAWHDPYAIRLPCSGSAKSSAIRPSLLANCKASHRVRG